MPRTVHLRPGHGFKASAISRVLHPSDLIRGKWSNTWHRERVAGLVFVGRYLWVVRRGIPATDAFIMRHEDLPNNNYMPPIGWYISKKKAPKKIFSIWIDLTLNPT